MIKKTPFVILLILIFTMTGLCQSRTLRIMTYNLLNYIGQDKNENFKTIVEAIDPDIIVVQEIEGQTAVDSFSIAVLENRFDTIGFHNGCTYDTDNHIFYNPYEIVFLTDQYISTALRDIAEYKLKIPGINDTLLIYSAHLKASSGIDNEQKRLAESTLLREHLNQHSPTTKFILVGDLNLYSSLEPAYQKLTGEEAENSGRLFDPIQTPGIWHNNSRFTAIHTQSTRTSDIGDDGATGGMDDRFDFILVSGSLSGRVIQGSYTAYGNDGAHFNQSIISGSNGAVSPEIANALYYASDHLPVYTDISFGVSTIAEEISQVPTIYWLGQNYPNPFNPRTMITYELQNTNYIHLTIFNLLGQNVANLFSGVQKAGRYEVPWDAADFPSGIYYYRLQAAGFSETRKMILTK